MVKVHSTLLSTKELVRRARPKWLPFHPGSSIRLTWVWSSDGTFLGILHARASGGVLSVLREVLASETVEVGQNKRQIHASDSVQYEDVPNQIGGF